MSVRLSVIIPAYNRAHLLGETVRSLLAQTLPADEIIVVDDGSNDNTAETAASFGSAVKVIRRSNGGPAAARNSGFKASRGEFIHFFDSDDLAAKNKHQVQVEALETSGADIAIGPWIQGYFADGSFRTENLVLQQNGIPSGQLVKALLTSWSFVPHSAIFRRQVVEAVGGFDEELFVAEDQLMFLNCLLAGARVIHTPGTIEFYRLGDVSKITENKKWTVRRRKEWAQFLLKARTVCLAKGIEPLKWLGYRRRILQAEQDLRDAGVTEADLMGRLHRMVPRNLAAFGCYCEIQFERVRGGLQRRFTSGRAHPHFKIGPISSIQIDYLRQLGYKYQPPPFNMFQLPSYCKTHSSEML